MTLRSTGSGLRALLACAALGAASCGSSSLEQADARGGGGAPDGGAMAAMNCGDTSGPIDPTALIDDMEDGNFTIALNDSGAWWAGGDATPGGTIAPNGNANPELIPGGRCGSKYAEHVTGFGFTDWGAVLSMSFAYGSVDGGAPGLLPFDAHIRQGITFWARIGDTSTDQVRLAVSDKASRPEGGICVVNGPPGTTCYDTFGVQLTQLDTSWHQYRVPFGGLTQRHFGVEEPTLDTTTLYTIEFALGPGAIFDFWIDDISFF
jgi:hypothetical protein